LPSRPDTGALLSSKFLLSKTAAALIGLGSIGVLALIPITAWQIGPLPTGTPPSLALAALAALQPFALLVAGAFAGAFAAPRMGFRSILAELLAGDAVPDVSHGLAGPLVASVVLGLFINVVDALTRPLWLPAGADWPQYAAAWTPITLAFGMLYGGLTEEVVFRWGAMSLIAWTIWRLGGARRPVGRRPILAGIVLSALLFGVAHLPTLVGTVPLSAGPVTRTVLLNGLAGLWLGSVFWRRHLEAAMACHAAIHVGFAAYAVGVLALG
jgi:hypothetical protein